MLWFGWLGPLFLTGLTQVFNISWSQIAPRLAYWNNPRTQVKLDTDLTKFLGYGRLVFYVSPFLFTMIGAQFTDMKCANGVDELDGIKNAANNFYAFDEGKWPRLSGEGWAENTSALEVLHEWITPYTFPIQNTSISAAFGITEPLYCVWGCQPTACTKDAVGKVNCASTTCVTKGESQIYMAFASQVACQVTFWFLLPMALVTYTVMNESAAVKEAIPGTARDKGKDEKDPVKQQKDAEKGHTPPPNDTSVLQYQAKCASITPYEYLSWGGSYVEDFQELVDSFALIICFGAFQPIVAFFAAFTQLIGYKLLSYRMTHITCRPYPHPAKGITYWLNILDDTVACSVHVMALVFPAINPVKDLPVQWKLICWLFIGYLFSSITKAVDAIMKSDPPDVSIIDDYNSMVLRRIGLKNQVADDEAKEMGITDRLKAAKRELIGSGQAHLVDNRFDDPMLPDKKYWTIDYLDVDLDAHNAEHDASE